jgi:hypothetical protein
MTGKSDEVIVGANGIGTPRLLQMSGLGTRSGLLGRRLMMHPWDEPDGRDHGGGGAVGAEPDRAAGRGGAGGLSGAESGMALTGNKRAAGTDRAGDGPRVARASRGLRRCGSGRGRWTPSCGSIPRARRGCAGSSPSPGRSRLSPTSEALAQAETAAFGDLAVVLANAYPMHPETRAAIGYPGQEARDSSVGLTEADLALVAAVRARGPVWRDARALRPGRSASWCECDRARSWR